MRVLVVEDDDGVAQAIVAALSDHGYRTRTVGRAVDVWQHVHDVDLVLLDLGLPDGDGLEVLRRIRRIGGPGVLVLTARGTERDIVRGLRLGADDYLVKPVRLGELLARIEAIRRRLPAPGDSEVAAVRIGPLTVDPAARTATVDAELLDLTSKEFDILAVLARRPGAAVSRQEVLDAVWGDAYLAVSRSLDVHVANLRTKLGTPGLLTTIRGFGYRLGG
ncbi:response regulator transcription factor [Pseudonocardia sp. CA-107938]|uniref:response regulator transcription factor n=1 Tax=Pseudonocardia sp. CA-107938 TaxID=3240021 RepID=UPI003D920449